MQNQFLPNDPSQADKSIISLMHGIKSNEGTGGNYQGIGDKGTAAGIGQWSNQVNGVPIPLQQGQIPENFKSQAKQYGLNPDDFSAENQNKTMYATLSDWKKQGLTPEQALSKWNSGDPDKYLNVATSTGVGPVGAYDVENYVKKGMTAAQRYAQQNSQVNTDPNNPSSVANTNPVQEPEKKDGFLKSLITDPIKTLVAKPADRVAELVGRTGLLGKTIKTGYEEMADKGEGRTFNGINVEAQKGGVEGAKQIGGDALKAASYLYTGGEAPEAISQGLSGAVKASALQGAKVGAIGGATYGAGEGLQQEKGGVGSAITGGLIGGLTGGIGGGILGGATPLVAKGLMKPTQEMFDKAIINVADEYRKLLPLTPTQRAMEAKLLARGGDDVYTTLAKHGINLGSDEAPKQLNEISDQFRSAIKQAQKNESAYFNLDEIRENAFKQIDDKISSEMERQAAKEGLEKEITALVNSNKKSVIQGANGETLVNSDVVERMRKTGNDWAQYNKFNPNTVKNASGSGLANAVRDQVEKQGTFPAYREASKEWGKIIHAQEILSNIDRTGKQFKTPGGLAGSISRKLLSGAFGLHTGGVGGMILAEMGSEYGARLLSNPEMRTFLNRRVVERFGSKTPSEQAINTLAKEIMEFMDKQASLPKLPAPSYIPTGGIAPKPSGIDREGTKAMEEFYRNQAMENTKRLPAGSTIQLGPKTPNPSTVKSVPAKKGLIGVEPKTGRFKTTYRSDL